MLKPEMFFNLDDYEHKALFDGAENVWDAFNNISEYINQYLEKIPIEERIKGVVKGGAILVNKDEIYIGEGAKIEPTAYIEGPAIIGPESIVGTAAYIRSGTVLGRHCIIGHCTEAKNTIMLDDSAAPHFNFIGDSILGNNVNIGAGVILANFRLDEKPVPIGEMSTGLVKLGAILGDRVKIGCNSVLEPGTFLGPDTWVLPTAYFKKGYYRRGENRKEIIKEI
ncbi:hypothetical protein KJ885_00715 [Patescibacteria group bacterium]|nr:hypothetical protein [Patescibacteria group bacterium]